MWKKLLFGAAAGALGGVAMKAVVHFADPDSFGLSANTDAGATRALWRRMHREQVGERTAMQIGAAMHYAFSISTGSVYAASAGRFPVLRAGRGAAFGALLWLIGDEAAMTVSGLEDPLRTSIASHASALGAHVLYGMILDAAYEKCANPLTKL